MADTNLNYLLFNYSLESDIPFIGVPTTDKNSEIILKEDLNLERKSSKKSLQNLSLNKGWIENSELIADITPNRVNYKFLRNLEAHTKQTKLLHQTMPSILFQNDYLVLHAAAFIYKDFGVLICGPSTYGKSETINKLSSHFQIISDDIVALDVSQESIKILPGLTFTSIKNGEEELSLNDKRKRYFKAFEKKHLSSKGAVLKKVVLLDWGNKYKFKKIEESEAFKKLLANSFRPLPSSHCLDSEKRHFQNLSNLIKKTDQYIFERERDDIDASTKFLIRNL